MSAWLTGFGLVAGIIGGILPRMIEGEHDLGERACLEQTLLLVGLADKLALTSIPWDEAKQAAFDKFPPLTDEQLERAREAR